MKKLALLIAALFVVGTAAFAVDAELSVAIEGDASVTFVYDLDAGQFGISNEANAKLTVSFAANGDETNTSDEEVTGFITIKFEDVKIDTDAVTGSGTGASVGADVGGGVIVSDVTTVTTSKPLLAAVSIDAARVQFGSMFALNVLGLDKAIDYASQGQGLPFVIENATVGDAKKTSAGDNGYGFEFNFADALALNIGLGTPFDYTTNADGDVIIFAGLEVTAVEGLTAKLGFQYDTQVDGAWGLGAEVGYDLGVLSILVGVDVNSAEAFQLGAGVVVPLGEEETDKFDVDDIAASARLGFSLDDAGNVDINVFFFDGEAIEVLEAVAILEVANFENIGLGLYLAADLDVVKPWASIEYQQSFDILGLVVGVDITVIPLTTFTLRYANADVNTDLGGISFFTKVAF